LSQYHEKSSILLQEPEKIPQAKRDASFGVKRTFKGCPWLFLVTIILPLNISPRGRVASSEGAIARAYCAGPQIGDSATEAQEDSSNRERMARHSE
jgi:hypothetical protein